MPPLWPSPELLCALGPYVTEQGFGLCVGVLLGSGCLGAPVVDVVVVGWFWLRDVCVGVVVGGRAHRRGVKK